MASGPGAGRGGGGGGIVRSGCAARLCDLRSPRRGRLAALRLAALPRPAQGKIERDGEPEPLPPMFQQAPKRKFDAVRRALRRAAPPLRALQGPPALASLQRPAHSARADARLAPSPPRQGQGGGPPKARKITAQPVARQPGQLPAGANPFAAPAPRPAAAPALSAQQTIAKVQAVVNDPLGSLFAPKQIPAAALARHASSAPLALASCTLHLASSSTLLARSRAALLNRAAHPSLAPFPCPLRVRAGA